MIALLFAEATAAAPLWQRYVYCPTFWALALGAVGLWLLIPAGRTIPAARACGGALAVLAGLLFAFDWPALESWGPQAAFWLLALLTLGAGVAMLAARSPVYSALWFAASLVGTSGLYLLQGAQFLGMATIVVYAGAIVVTFLFVLMLAQPEGHATYDRLGWGTLPAPLAILVACLLTGSMLGVCLPWKNSAAVAQNVPSSTERTAGVLAPQHMALLGRELFSKQLIAVEVAGSLLMAALVGAVAIAIHGKSVAETAAASTASRESCS
jgi:NADH-quinone oxidoreductase subunit J